MTSSTVPARRSTGARLARVLPTALALVLFGCGEDGPPATPEAPGATEPVPADPADPDADTDVTAPGDEASG